MPTFEHPDLANLLASDPFVTAAEASPATSAPPAAPLPVAYRPPAVPGLTWVRPLGHGGMGAVWLARQAAPLDRLVAVKLILAGTRAAEIARERFQREVKALASLRHPHIVGVYGYDSAGGQPHCLMEYCPGGSLADHLGGNPLPPPLAATVVEAVAIGVGAAHAAEVLHRDLKPANVLLQRPATAAAAADLTLGELIPKVSDFGLAVRPDDAPLTVTEAAVGTPNYMPPEQTRGGRDLTPAADVYALGAILYECLTGRPPFVGPTPFDMIQLVRTEEPVAPRLLQPAVPRDLETVCLKCLRKEPGKRYATAAELAADLGRFRRGEPVVARPAGPVERGVKWVRRNRAAAAVIAAVVFAAVGVATAAMAALDAQKKASVADVARVKSEAAALGDRRLQLQAAVQLARQQGRWRDVPRLIDEAVAAGVPESVDLALDRGDALAELGDTAAALAVADRLDARPALGADRGRVEAFRGDVLLFRDDPTAEAMLERAMTHELPPATMRYVEGLLAADVVTAVRCFEDAVALDATHLSARQLAASLQTILGRKADARQTAGRGADLFPDVAVFDVQLLMLDYLDENRIAFADRLARLQRRPQFRGKSLTPLLDLYDTFAPWLAKLREGDVYGSPTAKELLAVTTAIPRIQAVGRLLGDRDGPGGRVVNVLPVRVQRRYAQVFGPQFFMGLIRDRRGLVRQVGALSEVAPEGVTTLARAMAELGTLPGDPPLPAERVRRGRDAAALALARPGMTDVRRPALDLLIVAEAAQIPTDPAALKAAVARVRDRLALGPMLDASLASIAIAVATLDGEHDLAGYIIGSLPPDQRAMIDESIRAQVELNRGGPAEAIRIARRMLDRKQGDTARLLDIVRQAEAKLRDDVRLLRLLPQTPRAGLATRQGDLPSVEP